MFFGYTYDCPTSSLIEFWKSFSLLKTDRSIVHQNTANNNEKQLGINNGILYLACSL